jgi:hypothetical protein
MPTDLTEMLEVSNLERRFTKRLQEICDWCGYPKCDYFDWEIPKKLLDMEEKDD